MRPWLLVVGLLVQAAPAAAHELRPVYLELQETAAGRFLLQLKLPPSLPAPPAVILPPGCESDGEAAVRPQSDGLVLRRHYHCVQGLAGGRLEIRPAPSSPPLTTIAQLGRLNGERHSRVIRSDAGSWQLPPREAPGTAAWEYLWLGAGHIWLGIDHLLFVACLLFVAGTLRRLLLIITGFTLAHSLTLILASLDWLRLPAPPVEAAIALSILFLATEIAGGRRDSWGWRYPVLVSTLFGLLHGFGFASALRDTGLPQTQLPAALLGFNLGVEIGQLLFVAACLALYAAARQLLPTPGARRLPQFCSYLVGTTASFWLIDRLTGFVA